MSNDPAKAACVVLHTDDHGNVIPCPGHPYADDQDTGRRCPRCDCADGHTQCQHCKVCPHVKGKEAP